MLQEIEQALLAAIKQFMINPNLIVTELHALYIIYKDLKAAANGNIKIEG